MRRYDAHKSGFHHILRIGRRVIFVQFLVIIGLVAYIIAAK